MSAPDIATLKIVVDSTELKAAIELIKQLGLQSVTVEGKVVESNKKQKQSATDLAAVLEKQNFTIAHQSKVYENLIALMGKDTELARSSAAQRIILNSAFHSSTAEISETTVAGAKLLAGLKSTKDGITSLAVATNGLTSADIKLIDATTRLNHIKGQQRDITKAQIKAEEPVITTADAHVEAYRKRSKAIEEQTKLANEYIKVQARLNASLGLSSKKEFLFSPIAQDPNVIKYTPAKPILSDANAHVAAYQAAIKASRTYQEQLAKEIIAIQARNNAQMGLSSKKQFLFVPFSQDPNVIATIDATSAALIKKEAVLNRARSSIRQYASYMASLTFEMTGAIYGLTAMAAAFAGPAIMGLKLQKSMEDAQAAITGILVSMGKLNGQSIGVADGWKIASVYIKAVHADAIRLGIDMSKLVEVNRAIMAPGLAKGINLKEIRELATMGAVAVSTIGLNSVQYVQEIRDLIAGGIQPASSTLATALGITDALLKQWTNAGTLVDNLKDRLRGFSEVAERLKKSTLSGAWEILVAQFKNMMVDPAAFTGLVGAINSISDAISKPDFKAAVEYYWGFLKGVGKVIGDVTGFLYTHRKAIELLIIAYGSLKIIQLAAWHVRTIATSASTAAIITNTAAVGANATASLGALAGIGAGVKTLASTVMMLTRGIGIIGLVLYGAFQLADYFGLIDQIFLTAEQRARKFQKSILGMSMEMLQTEIKSASDAYIKAKQNEEANTAIRAKRGYAPNPVFADVTTAARSKYELLMNEYVAKEKENSALQKMMDAVTASPIGTKDADKKSKADAELNLALRAEQAMLDILAKGSADKLTILEKYQSDKKRIEEQQGKPRTIAQVEASMSVLQPKVTDAERIAKETTEREKSIDAIGKETAAINEKAAQLEFENTLIGQTMAKIAELTEARITAAILALEVEKNLPGKSAAEITAIEAKIAAVKRLSAATAAGVDLKAGENWQVKQAADAAQAWKDAGSVIKSAMGDAFGSSAAAAASMVDAFAQGQGTMMAIASRRAADEKTYGADSVQMVEINAQASNASAAAQISQFAAIAGAAKGMFKSNSDGYLVLKAAEQAFRLLQMALAIKSLMVDTSVTAGKVVNTEIQAASAGKASVAYAGMLPPPWGLISMGVVFAALVAMGVKMRGAARAGAAAEKAAAIADQRYDMTTQITRLSGNESGAVAMERSKELAAMDASLRALQQRIYYLKDEKAALENLSSLIGKQGGLAAQIQRLMGNEAGATTIERDLVRATMPAAVSAADVMAATAAANSASIVAATADANLINAITARDAAFTFKESAWNALSGSDKNKQKMGYTTSAMQRWFDADDAFGVAIAKEAAAIVTAAQANVLLTAQRKLESAALEGNIANLQEEVWRLQDLAAAKAAMKLIDDKRFEWQNKLDVLTGAKTQQQITRTADLASTTDAATLAIIGLVHAQEDLNAAALAATAIANTRTSADIRLMNAQGNTQGALTAQRLLDIVGMSDGQIAAYDYSKGIDATITAMQKAAATAATLVGWQDKLDVLTGAKTQEQISRAADLASTTDAATLAIIRQVHAQEDLKKSHDVAINAFKDVVTATNSLREFGKSVRELMLSLSTGAQAPGGVSASLLKSVFIATNALAASGNIAAQGKLGGAATAYLDIAREQSATQLDYARSFAFVQGSLEVTATAIEGVVSAADLTLQAAVDANNWLKDIAKNTDNTYNNITALGNELSKLPAAIVAAGGSISQPMVDAMVAFNTAVTTVYTQLTTAITAGYGSIVAAVTGVPSTTPAIVPIVTPPQVTIPTPVVVAPFVPYVPPAYSATNPNPALVAARDAEIAKFTIPYSKTYSPGGAAAQEARKLGLAAALAMPTYASGGYHSGGLRIVGENGPELESTGPSRIFSNSQSRNMFAANDSGSAEMVKEIRQLRAELQAANIAIAQASQDTSKMLRRWEGGGMPQTREAA